jgi:hypothetical protein
MRHFGGDVAKIRRTGRSGGTRSPRLTHFSVPIIKISMVAQRARGLALSNRTGLINLGTIVEPENRARRRSHLTDICVLAASRSRAHIPSYRSTDGSGRPGAAIWKACLGTFWMLGQVIIARSRSGSFGDVERQCHVAINSQI